MAKWKMYVYMQRPPQGQSVAKPGSYPSIEYKFDIREFDGNMFNAMFWKKAHGLKHPGRWAIGAPKETSFTRPKPVVQMG